MKNTKHIFYLYVSIVMLIIASCTHKYPDDPHSTTQSVKSRLCKKWALTNYKINGVDSVIPHSEILSLTYDNSDLVKDMNTSPYFYIVDYTGEEGPFTLNNDNTDISFGGNTLGYKPTGQLFYPYNTYTILELYKSTLKLTRTDNGKTRELDFTEKN